MYYCVSYDISSNRTRRFAVKCCKQAGLLRLQRSVFAGASAPESLTELENLLRPMLAPDDRLAIIPLDKKAWREISLSGNQPSKDRLSRKEDNRYF
jgi:CRISPR-associated protein Cas2